MVRYKAQESGAPDGMRPDVWDMAKAVRKCAVKNGEISESANLAIIDYDMPSSEKRLWIVDPSKSQTLAKDWVAHGSGSGELIASRFSNTEGSFQSSLGVFRVGEVYKGQHGASLRLDGLEARFNDQARPRSIVMHAAWYVSPTVIEDTGRLGRSQGCPAVRSSVLDIAEKELAEGGLLFSYSSKSKWTEKSSYLQC